VLLVVVACALAAQPVLVASMSLSAKDIEKHVWYFCACLRLLPEPYTSLDGNRMTAVSGPAASVQGCLGSSCFERRALLCGAWQAYFAVAGLDVLGQLDAAYSVVPREKLIQWVYNLQVVPQTGDVAVKGHGGFQGGTHVGLPFMGDMVSVFALCGLSLLWSIVVCLELVQSPAHTRAAASVASQGASSWTVSHCQHIHCACAVAHAW